VNVILGDDRQVVVDDQGELRDVETACRDVGGYQYVHATRLEVTERPCSGALVLVAVDYGRFDPGLFEVLPHTIRASLRLAEDERLVRTSRLSTCVSAARF